MNVYEQCPEVSTDRYALRLVRREDAADLLRVYADPAAWPLFNGDNCNGDDFRYTTMEQMAKAIQFWIWSYENGWFVRFGVQDRLTQQVIGTIELFRSEPAGQPRGTAVLRLDLRSDYETEDTVGEIVQMVFPRALTWFDCEGMKTKIVPQAKARAAVFGRIGFAQTDMPVIGQDGSIYGDYWIWPGETE